MPIYECRIEPLEPILFGDHRAARSGIDHVQLDQDPSPVTLHGALGTFVLRRHGDGWPRQILGGCQKDVLNPTAEMAELLGYGYRTERGSVLFPRPRHLRCRPGRGARVRPVDLLRPMEIGSAEASTAPRFDRLMRIDPPSDVPVRAEVEEPVWITVERLADVLTGVTPTSDDAYLESAIFRLESRPGIAVDNTTGQVFEGAFFNRPYRRFAPAPLEAASGSNGDRPMGAGFTAWFRTLGDFKPGDDPVGFLGGDRRRARFLWNKVGEAPTDVLKADLLSQVTEAAEDTETEGFLLYLLTPALVTDEPVQAEGMEPVAAVLGPAGKVSGWNVKGGHPRELHSLVPAGSVYFFRWPDGADRGQIIRRHWLQPLREKGGAVGFGRALVGVWR